LKIGSTFYLAEKNTQTDMNNAHEEAIDKDTGNIV
jgi:hypothetical protein